MRKGHGRTQNDRVATSIDARTSGLISLGREAPLIDSANATSEIIRSAATSLIRGQFVAVGLRDFQCCDAGRSHMGCVSANMDRRLGWPRNLGALPNNFPEALSDLHAPLIQAAPTSAACR